MRVYICDDNELDRERLCWMLERYLRQLADRSPRIRVSKFRDADQMLDALQVGAPVPDLVFLDIYMGKTDGIEACERLQMKDGIRVPVIFCTASTGHALEAYRLHAAGYLYKPFTQADFDQVMKNVEPLFRWWGRSLSVWDNEKNGIRCIALNDICYLESDDRSTLFHISADCAESSAPEKKREEDVPLTVRSPVRLRDCRNDLDDEPDFFVCGRSYIINLHHVVSLGDDGFCMDNGDLAPVPYRLHTAAEEALREYRFLVEKSSVYPKRISRSAETPVEIYICDDNELDRRRLAELFFRCCRKYFMRPQIREFADGASLLEAYRAAERKPALLFLDIRMEGMDGMELASQLRDKDDAAVPLIFTTSSEEYAIETFRISADGFLKKPFTMKELEQTVEPFEKILEAGGRTLSLKKHRGKQEILLNRILYIESDVHSSDIHTVSGIVHSGMDIGRFRSMLADEEGFLECGKSYVVNMNHVKSWAGNVITMQNDEAVYMPLRLAGQLRTCIENWFSCS